jgi:hypothetical protein
VFGGDETILQTERYNMITDTWEDFGQPWPYHLVAVTGGTYKNRYLFTVGGLNYTLYFNN